MATKREPFVGPRPFEKDDREFFFGRKQEANDLISLITAHPIVLLYAQSGAGKTSLLQASLTYKLREEELFNVLPVARVQGQISVPLEPEQIQNIYMFNGLVNLSGNQPEQAALSRSTLAEFLKKWRDRSPDPKRQHSPLVVIFDQFEELFTNYPERWEDRKHFFAQISEALEADPLLRVVFAMREDYIAELDPYAQMLPEKLRMRFRMERLRREAALAAVTGPLARLHEQTNSTQENGAEETDADGSTTYHFAPGVATALVDNLMQIRVTGPEGEKVVSGEFVEPIQLQVVCQTLWRKLKPTDTVITFQNLVDYGDVNKALTEFYVQAIQSASAKTGIKEGDLRAWFDRVMITSDGARNIVIRGRTETAGLRNESVQVLVEERILRAEKRDNKIWYELSQDRFIQPIQESYKVWLLEQPEERTRLRLVEQAAKWLSSRPKDNTLLLNQGDLALANQLIETEGPLAASSQTLLPLIQASEAAFVEIERERERALAEERQRHAESERARAVEQAAARQREAEQAQALVVEQKRLAETESARAAEEERRIQAELQQAKEERLRADVERQRAEEQAAARQRESEQAQTTARRLRRLAIALAAMFLLSIGTAVFAFYKQSQARASEQEARTAQSQAVIERRRTEEQRNIALASEQEARAAQSQAVSEKQRADEQTNIALEQKAEADAQRQKAMDASRVAKEQEALAETARDSARDAEATATDAAKRANTEKKAADAAKVKAEKQSEISASRELAASAISQLTEDPELSLLLSTEAVQRKKPTEEPTEEAVNALRQSLVESHARAVQQPLDVLIGNAIFSSDGKSVLFADKTGAIKQWVVNEGVAPGEALTLFKTGFDIEGISSGSKDNNYFVIRLGNFAQVWRVQDKRLVMTAKSEADVRDAALSPDNKYLAVASEGKTAKIFDVETEELISVLPNDDGSVNTAAFSPDNKLVVTAGDDRAIRVWKVQKDVPGVLSLPILKLGVHDGPVNSVAFSPDGKYIVTASDDRTARLWRTDKETTPESQWQPAFQLLGHEGPVNSAAFSPDSKYVVTSSMDGTARVWDVMTGRSVAVLRGHRAEVYNATFSPDGRSIITSSRDNTMRLWRLGENTEAKVVLSGHTGIVSAVAYSPDGNLVVTASYDNTARIWDAHTRQLLALLDKHTEPVVDAAFSPDSRLVATASDDKTARVWEARTGRLISTFENEEALAYVKFSADGESVFTVNIYGASRLWDIKTGESVALQFPEETSVKWENDKGRLQLFNSAAISPDGTLAAVSFYLLPKPQTVTKEGVRIWDTRSKRVVIELPERGSGMGSMAFSPDDQYLIMEVTTDVAAIHFERHVWEIKTGRLLSQTEEKYLPGIRFSPDGKMFLTTYGIERVVRIWDAKTGLNLSTLQGYSGDFTSAIFSPDSKLVMTVSEDGLVEVWDAASGRSMLEIRNEQREDLRKLTGAVFSPDGSSILVGGYDQKARIYSCDFCGSLPALLERAQKQKTRDLTDKEKQKYLPPSVE